MYKYVKSEKDTGKVIQIEEGNVVEASDVVVNQDKYPEWRVDRVMLKGVA